MITTKEILRKYKESPDNVLCLFVGKVKVLGEKNLTRKDKIIFEPFKEIKNKIYFCGDLFQTEVLDKFLEGYHFYVFDIIDGNWCLMERL